MVPSTVSFACPSTLVRSPYLRLFSLADLLSSSRLSGSGGRPLVATPPTYPQDARARLVHHRSLDPDSRHLRAVAAAVAALCRAPPDPLGVPLGSLPPPPPPYPTTPATDGGFAGAASPAGGGCCGSASIAAAACGNNGYAAAATPSRPQAVQQSTTFFFTSGASGRPRRRATSARHDGYGGSDEPAADTRLAPRRATTARRDGCGGGDKPAADARLAYSPAGVSGPATAGGCHRHVSACGVSGRRRRRRPRVTVNVAATAFE